MFPLKSAELLFKAASELGLQPEWMTSYGLFSIQHKTKTAYIFFSKNYLNSALSAYLSKNKQATHLILQKNEIPNTPFIYSKRRQDVEDFLQTHQKIIAKPIAGKQAKDIHVFTTTAALPTPVQNYIFEKYIDGKEYRYLVLNNKVIAVHERQNVLKKERRRSLLKKDWDARLKDYALRAADAVKLGFAAVDFIVDHSDNPFVLEINSAPGIAGFYEPHEGPVVDVARLFLQAIIKRI